MPIIVGKFRKKGGNDVQLKIQSHSEFIPKTDKEL